VQEQLLMLFPCPPSTPTLLLLPESLAWSSTADVQLPEDVGGGDSDVMIGSDVYVQVRGGNE
jgi:hypothetical protein